MRILLHNKRVLAFVTYSMQRFSLSDHVDFVAKSADGDQLIRSVDGATVILHEQVAVDGTDEKKGDDDYVDGVP